MNRIALFALAILLMMAFSGAPGWAQTTTGRTFVSGTGNDTNPCSRTQPCRGFARAISLTSAGGEVIVLDSAGYGAFTISGAISISATGVDAAISVTSGDGITINAGASDVVNLRGLTITGTSGAGNGITLNTGGTLNIQNCVVRGFGNDGIHLSPTTAGAVNIADTVASNNANDGIRINAPGGAIHAFFERVQAIGNANHGLFFGGNGALITALVANSLAANNQNEELDVEGSSAVTLVGSNLTAGGVGIYNSSLLVLSNSIIYNSYGFSNGGTIKTFGNNGFPNNVSSTGNGLTPIAQQ